MKFIQWLRSLLFFAFFAITTVIFACLILLSFWAGQKLVVSLVRAWCVANLFLLKYICGLSYKVKGLQNLLEAEKEGGVVIMCKHQSTLETLILFAELKNNPALILKKELLSIPFYGWGLAKLNPIAIDRKNRSSAMEQVIAKGSEAIEQGRSVLIFPEGTRTPFGEPTKVKKGGINLAIHSGAVMVPVALNTGKFWPKSSLLIHPGQAILSFGQKIGANDNEVNVLSLQNEVKHWIDAEIANFQ